MSESKSEEIVGNDKTGVGESNGVGDNRVVPPENAGRSVNRGILAVALAIVLSLVWYLLAGRYTPFTSQARIEGFVAGVAPQVAGTVTRMMVTNNQEVKRGQPLFEV